MSGILRVIAWILLILGLIGSVSAFAVTAELAEQITALQIALVLASIFSAVTVWALLSGFAEALEILEDTAKTLKRLEDNAQMPKRLKEGIVTQQE